MKYSTLIEDMITEGATPEMILVAVRAVERQETDALERRRAADRARQERHRTNPSRDKTLRNVSHGLSRSHAGVDDKTLPSEIEPQKKVSKEARAARLPENWTLPVEWRADALAAKLPEHLIDLEASKMRDWSQSAPKGAKTNWRPAWRNWCREAAARAGQHPRAGPPPKPNPALAAADALMEKFDAVSPSQTEANSPYPRLVAVAGGG